MPPRKRGWGRVRTPELHTDGVPPGFRYARFAGTCQHLHSPDVVPGRTKPVEVTSQGGSVTRKIKHVGCPDALQGFDATPAQSRSAADPSRSRRIRRRLPSPKSPQPLPPVYDNARYGFEMPIVWHQPRHREFSSTSVTSAPFLAKPNPTHPTPAYNSSTRVCRSRTFIQSANV